MYGSVQCDAYIYTYIHLYTVLVSCNLIHTRESHMSFFLALAIALNPHASVESSKLCGR